MMSETIQILMLKRKMTQKDVAEEIGCTAANISALLRKDNFREEELRKIAEALNCDLRIEFEMKDTKEKFYFSTIK